MDWKHGLDISDDSAWAAAVPSKSAKRLPFYLVEYGKFKCGSNFSAEKPGAGFLLLVYTVSGNGKLAYDGRDYILEPETGVLINCGKTYSISNEANEPWNVKWIYFGGSSIAEYDNIINPDGITVFKITDQVYFNRLIDKASVFLGKTDVAANAGASLHISEVLTYLVNLKFTYRRKGDENRKKFNVDKTIKYIQDNYKKKITIDQLAKDAMMSKFYFIKLFSLISGESPYSYIMKVRINKAMELLATSDISVKDIAFETGFTSSNNFNKAFRKSTGMSPTDYRNRSV